MKSLTRGFTIVELTIVIVVLAILAGIVMVSYSNWREDTITTTMKNDLLQLASAMNNARNFSEGYPSTIPDGFSSSDGNVVQLSGASLEHFCATIYNAKLPSVVLSYSSGTQKIVNYPCGGVASGPPIGGSVPKAPRGINLLGTFDNWQLNGTAHVSSGELIMGTNGTATTPAIRVDGPARIYVGGDFYAKQQSVRASKQPDAAYHVGIAYFGSDGSTRVENTSGYKTNGCARNIPKDGWTDGVDSCSFTGGPNVIYVKVTYHSSGSGYSSPDLKVRNPLVRVAD